MFPRRALITRLTRLVTLALVLIAIPQATSATPPARDSALQAPQAVGQRAATAAIPTGEPFELVSSIGATVKTAVISGTLAYVGEDRLLTIFDISDLAQPRRLSHTQMGGEIVDIQVRGHYAYLMLSTLALPLSYNSLQVVDVRAPSKPVRRGYEVLPYSIDSAASPETQAVGTAGSETQVVGSRLYVTQGNLLMFDVGNPDDIRPVGSFKTPGFASGVQVVGSTAYIADDEAGLQIVNISNPLSPALVGSYDTPGQARDVEVVGSFAYVADGTGGLRIIDISSPAAPAPRGSYDTPGQARHVEVAGSFAYVADSGNLLIFDISSHTPAPRGSLIMRGIAVKIQVDGTRAFVVNANDGLLVVDVSDVNVPVLNSRLTPPTISANSVQVAGTMAYLAAYGALQIVDVSDPVGPKLRGSIDLLSSGTDIKVVNGRAFIASTFGITTDVSLQIVDVSNPDNPTLLSSFNQGGNTFNRRVQIVGDLAYLMSQGATLLIVDVSNPAAPALRGSIEVPGAEIADVAVVDGLAYTIGDALRVIDVSNPISPTLLGSLPAPNDDYLMTDIEVDGNVAYISAAFSGRAPLGYSAGYLDSIDVSTPESPKRLSSTPTPKGIWDIHLSDGLAYVGMDGSKIAVYDVSVPSKPVLRAANAMPVTSWFSTRFLMAGDLLYAAGGDGGFHILRLHQDRFPPQMRLPLLRR